MKLNKSFSNEGNLEIEQSEYNIEWKDLIFLPFNATWNFILQCTIVLNAAVCLFDFTFVESSGKEAVLDLLHYAFEVPFLMDVILSIMHRNMESHRITRINEPRNIFLLAIDVLTLIPVYEVYLFFTSISRYYTRSRFLRDGCRTVSAVRLYRVFMYLHDLACQAGHNQVIIITLAEFLKVFLSSYVGAVCLYALKCWRCEDPNWTRELEKLFFNPKEPQDWFVISYVVMGRLFIYSYRGIIRAQNIPERLLMMASMMTGFILHGMVYLGALTEAIQKHLLRQYIFERQLSFIISVLDDWRVQKEIKDKTLEYYQALWVKRTGIYFMPELFHMLPNTLQKEVTTDIYWEALRHSHLFRDMPLAFKRSLSLSMQSEMYLPGDYVFRLNELKSKMVYIVSGVVQILTGEDEESPLISFSNGTILGEASIIIPTKSNAFVRAASFCEVQTVSCSSLFTTLMSYQDLSESIRELLDYRVATAMYLRELKEEKSQKTKANSESFIDKERAESTIKWIKSRWRLLTKLQSSKRLKDESILTKHVQHEHTSRNLDLLVLSADFELKTKAICLTSRCPFILEPSSSFRKCCEYMIILACAVQAAILPYTILILHEIPSSTTTILGLADLFYVLDLYLQISTAIKDENQLLTRPMPILQYKLKSVWFIVDIIATAPLDLIATLTTGNKHSVMILRLNRVFKFYRVLQFIIGKEKSLLINYALIRVIKYMVIFTYSVYGISCVLFGISCPTKKACLPYTMFPFNDVLKGKKFKIGKIPIRYFHFVLSVFFHMNSSNNYEYTLDELLYGYGMALLGNILAIFFTAEMAAAFYIRYRERERYKIYIKSIKDYMIKSHVDPVLEKQVSALLKFQWYHSQNRTIVGESGVLTHAPTYLKNLIVYRRIITCLKAVPLFMGCEDELLKSVATRMVYRTLPPKALVTAADNRSRYLHCILRGFCTQGSIMPGDKERGAVTILRTGDSFPVVELLHQVLVLVNVRTLTSVELISISYNDLVEIFHANQSFSKGVQMTLDSHMQTFDKSLKRKGGRLPDITSTERSKGQGELFKYELMDEDEINYAKLAFNKPFDRLGRWGVIRFFFLHRTVNPNGSHFLYWEISRFIISILGTFIAITGHNLLVKHTDDIEPVLYFFTATSIVDMYVRMHCQYHNKRGILVTHPLYTAKHYLKTSFAVDLWSILPTYMVEDLFGRHNKQQVRAVVKILTRPFSLHRLISYLNYRQMNIETTKTATLQALKYFVVIIAFLGILTTYVQLETCRISRNGTTGQIIVDGCANTWLASSQFKDNLLPEEIFLVCFYALVTLFTNTATGVYKSSAWNIHSVIILYIILFISKLFLFASLVGSRIRRNVNLTIFQERVRSFEQFMKKEMVDEDLVEAAIEHYKFRWKRNQGNDIAANLKEFHPQLHEDITYNLFSSTLKAVCFFEGADDSFFRLIGVQMKEDYFKKGVEIIRCNDVQNLVYIVNKGKVDVMVAKCKVCTLGKGGVFGCLSKTGKIRHTISVDAKVHVSVLTIDSVVFHKVVATYHRVALQVQHANFVNAEFLESKRYLLELDEEQSSMIEPSRSTFSARSTSRASRLFKVRSKIKVLKFFGMRIDSEGKKYGTYYYLMTCHLAPITSILYLLVIFNLRTYDVYGVHEHVVTSLIDILYLSKIYIGFNLSYRDADTGNTVKDSRLICRRYTYNVRKFFLDVVTCIPIEYILMIFYGPKATVKYGWVNRILRFDFFIQYYYEKNERLEVTTSLRLLYLTYWVLFIIQSTASLWMFVACTPHCIYFTKGILTKQASNYATSGNEDRSFVYNFAITMFTTTGLRVVQPTTLADVGICTLFAFLFFGVSVELAVGFITMFSISKYTMRTYEYEIEDLQIYLKGRKLSSFIFNKVWQYYLHLWRRQRGEWTPALITTAPSYLQQDLMYGLYGHYVESHVLFAKTHIHFIRQVVMYLKRCVFFPGNYLAEAGDIDGCMYFIHNGMVDVIDKSGTNETHMERLKKGNSFGEAQGLSRIPHKFHYCAYTVVDAVLLRYDDWQHLLHWFPASRLQMRKGAAELGLSMKNET